MLKSASKIAYFLLVCIFAYFNIGCQNQPKNDHRGELIGISFVGDGGVSYGPTVTCFMKELQCYPEWSVNRGVDDTTPYDPQTKTLLMEDAEKLDGLITSTPKVLKDTTKPKKQPSKAQLYVNAGGTGSLGGYWIPNHPVHYDTVKSVTATYNFNGGAAVMVVECTWQIRQCRDQVRYYDGSTNKETVEHWWLFYKTLKADRKTPFDTTGVWDTKVANWTDEDLKQKQPTTQLYLN